MAATITLDASAEPLDVAEALAFAALHIADTQLSQIERAGLLHQILKRLSGDVLAPDERRSVTSMSAEHGERHHVH